MLQQIHNLEYLELDQCRLITDSFISDIANFCPKLEHLDIGACGVSDTAILGTNVSKDALSKLNPKIKIKQNSTLEMDPEKELNDLWISLVYLVQDLWLSYSIVELERDMRDMAERLSLMVSMYGLKEKINYQPINPELDTNYVITEFVPRDIKYRATMLMINLSQTYVTGNENDSNLGLFWMMDVQE
ncbi:8929_t:CDS:2, partial [Diversispora eburnea]